MAIFGLMFLVVALVLVGIGVVVGLLACVVGACLVSVGVVGSSLFVGLRRGSPAGIRFFLIQCGMWAGTPAGAVVAWCLHFVINGHTGGWPILVSGAAGGALAGFIVALLLNAVVTPLLDWVAFRFYTLRQRRLA